MTALDIIKSALRKLNAYDHGEELEAAEAQDALVVLNDMLDSWNAERLSIFTTSRNVFTLTAGKQTYTLGVGGDFNIPRPPAIERITIISLTNPIQPLELPLRMFNTEEWSRIPVKNLGATIPTEGVYDDGAFPLRNLSYFYYPTVAVQTAIYVWQALTQFADLTTDYTFPPAYARAIKYNLAIDLAPEWGGNLQPSTALVAQQSKAVLQTLNAPVLYLRCDDALLAKNKPFNWLTGE